MYAASESGQNRFRLNAGIFIVKFHTQNTLFGFAVVDDGNIFDINSFSGQECGD